MATLPIGINNRDIKVNINDSCNCCLNFKKPGLGTTMYVNRHQEASPYDPQKTQSLYFATLKSHENVMALLEQIAIEQQAQKEQIKELVEMKSGIKILQDPPAPLTLNSIYLINEALRDIVK